MRPYPVKGLILFFCTLTLGMSGDAGADESADACAAAQRFAVDVAKRMRSGASADQEFNSNGGIDAVSKPMLNIINYVYSHRVNKDIAPVRIGALTLAKCNNGSFGRLGYADLPEQYNPHYQMTDEGGETWESGALPSVLPDRQQDDDAMLRGVSSGAGEPDANCEMYKQRVKKIDDQMRGGYTSQAGDSMREERRRYRELLNKHCS